MAYYPLDEVSGTVTADCSGNNHTGTVVGAGSGWTTGKFHGGYTPGLTRCIDLGAPLALRLEGGSFSVAMWANPASVPGGPGYLLSRTHDPINSGWRVGFDGPGLYRSRFFDSVAGVINVDSATGQPINTWTHFIATYSGGTRIIYLNGVSAAGRAARARHPREHLHRLPRRSEPTVRWSDRRGSDLPKSPVAHRRRLARSQGEVKRVEK
jgi:hypothetical protein